MKKRKREKEEKDAANKEGREGRQVRTECWLPTFPCMATPLRTVTSSRCLKLHLLHLQVELSWELKIPGSCGSSSLQLRKQKHQRGRHSSPP